MPQSQRAERALERRARALFRVEQLIARLRAQRVLLRVRVHVYVCVCACARVDALQGSVCFWSDVESPITSGTCQFVSVSDRYLKRFIGTVLIL